MSILEDVRFKYSVSRGVVCLYIVISTLIYYDLAFWFSLLSHLLSCFELSFTVLQKWNGRPAPLLLRWSCLFHTL